MPLLGSMAVVTLLLLGAVYAEYLEWQQEHLRVRDSVADQAQIARTRLEAEIHASIYLTYGLIAYVTTNGDVSQEDFADMAEVFVGNNHNIINFALAKDNIISHVYPMDRNTAVLGVDYRDLEDQWPDVEKAMITNRIVISGPLELLQGGVGIIARKPIFTEGDGLRPEDDGIFWGIAGIVIDANKLFRQAGLLSDSSPFRYAIRKINADAEPMVLGQQSMFERDPVLMAITLPGGQQWELAAIPRNGWKYEDPHNPWVHIGGVLVLILVGWMTYLLLLSQQRMRKLAMYDVLTGTMNRWFFEELMDRELLRAERDSDLVGVLIIDLNGFKPINDTYGHRAGDRVLAVIASRLMSNVRNADLVSRVGGDEFAVLLPALKNKNDIPSVVAKLRQTLSEPIKYEDRWMVVHPSIGYACFPNSGRDRVTLLRIADEAMYRNKAQLKAAADSGS